MGDTHLGVRGDEVARLGVFAVVLQIALEVLDHGLPVGLRLVDEPDLEVDVAGVRVLGEALVELDVVLDGLVVLAEGASVGRGAGERASEQDLVVVGVVLRVDLVVVRRLRVDRDRLIDLADVVERLRGHGRVGALVVEPLGRREGAFDEACVLEHDGGAREGLVAVLGRLEVLEVLHEAVTAFAELLVELELPADVEVTLGLNVGEELAELARVDGGIGCEDVRPLVEVVDVAR